MDRWRSLTGNKVPQIVRNFMPTEPINPADGRLQGRGVGMELIMEEAIVRQRDNNGYKFPNRYREEDSSKK